MKVKAGFVEEFNEKHKGFDTGDVVISKEGIIVLVTDPMRDSNNFEGVALNESGRSYLGDYQLTWAEEWFRPFYGTITIKAEKN